LGGRRRVPIAADWWFVSRIVEAGVVLVATTGTTAAVTALLRRWAVRLGTISYPTARGVHERATPTLGGAAMFAGLLVGMAVASRLPTFRPVFAGSSEPLGIVLAAAVVFAVGAIDDMRPLSAPAKLAGQVLAASILSLLGTTLFYFRVPFVDVFTVSPELAPVVTIVWVVLMVNAVNLIDGLDGLAAGIVAIAAGAFFLYSTNLLDAGLIGDGNVGPLLALVVLGLCVGFLPHNVHPARIFMGDCGALLLGLLMAASTISVGGRVVDQFSGQAYFFFAPLAIPFLVLGVPLLDVVFSLVRRATRGARWHEADKDHLHHRLMRLGHGHWRSVLILWGWTAILSALVLYPTYTGNGDAIVPLGVLALGLLLYTLFSPGLGKRAREAA
jgi:UDP-GlcNAc:undecaprenyl-phosphate GlcNAc-1-phosphate transferase